MFILHAIKRPRQGTYYEKTSKSENGLADGGPKGSVFDSLSPPKLARMTHQTNARIHIWFNGTGLMDLPSFAC